MKRALLAAAIIVAVTADGLLAQDASAELAALGKKATGFKTLRLIGQLGMMTGEEKARPEMVILAAYDKVRNSMRSDAVRLASGTIETSLTVGPVQTAWFISGRSRRVLRATRATGEQFRLGGKTLRPDLGIPGLVADALSGYVAVIATFDVVKAAEATEATRDITDVVWFSLKPKPGSAWGKADASQFAIAVDKTTGLPAAFTATQGEKGACLRLLSVETDVALGDVFTVPKYVRDAGIREFPPKKKTRK